MLTIALIITFALTKGLSIDFELFTVAYHVVLRFQEWLILRRHVKYP